MAAAEYAAAGRVLPVVAASGGGCHAGAACAGCQLGWHRCCQGDGQLTCRIAHASAEPWTVLKHSWCTCKSIALLLPCHASDMWLLRHAGAIPRCAAHNGDGPEQHPASCTVSLQNSEPHTHPMTLSSTNSIHSSDTSTCAVFPGWSSCITARSFARNCQEPLVVGTGAEIRSGVSGGRAGQADPHGV